MAALHDAGEPHIPHLGYCAVGVEQHILALQICTRNIHASSHGKFAPSNSHDDSLPGTTHAQLLVNLGDRKKRQSSSCARMDMQSLVCYCRCRDA